MSQRRSPIADLADGRRLWAVASVHGEAERLADVHRAIWERLAEGDRIVYLGNLIGHGAAVRATLDELLAFRRAVIARPRALACHVVFLRGRQEVMWQKLLQLQFTPDPGGALEWMLERGLEPTLRAYGGDPEGGLRAARAGTMALTRWTNELRAAMKAAPGHGELLGRLHNAAHTGEGGALFVNAGLEPRRALDQQSDLFWWHVRGFERLAEPYRGFARVVRGYDPEHAGLVERPHAVSLDAGAGLGGHLLAAAFDPAGEVLEALEA